MAEFNPYQAPQTVASVAAVGSEYSFEMGPEFLVVAKGARLCHAAIVTVLLTVVVFIIFGMILGMLGGALIALAMPVIFLICGVMHLVGMLMMSKIDPASRAPGLMLTAAILFGISFFGSVVLFVLQFARTVDATPAAINLVQSVISCAANILLLIALKRIGEYVQYPQITSKANGALWGICLVYGILILFIGLTIVAVLGNAPFLAQQDKFGGLTMIIGISIFVLAIYALISYSTAVSLIGKLPQIKLAVRNFQAPLQLPSNLNVPVAGQEMDFLQ